MFGWLDVDQLPLEQLFGIGACVDVTRKCAADRDYQVSVEDFQQWEAKNKAKLEGRIVLIRTGFSRRWPDAVRYLGTATRGEEGAKLLHFPGLHPDAATWMVARGESPKLVQQRLGHSHVSVTLALTGVSRAADVNSDILYRQGEPNADQLRTS